MTASATDHRRRPRRRGQALDAAILEATIAEIEEVGYESLRMERVAERAHASKGSLYRRWPSKVHLVMAAVYHYLPDPAGVSDTGSLRGDLLAVLGQTAGYAAGPAGVAIRGVLGEALRDPALTEQLRSIGRGTGLNAIRGAVRRAVERGELGPGPVTLRQLDAPLAVMRFHLLTTLGPIPPEVVAEIVDQVALPLFRAAALGSPR